MPGRLEALTAYIASCICALPVLQEHFFKNVQEAARNRALLLSYHPFWLRLGMEVVVGKQVAGECGLLAWPA